LITLLVKEALYRKQIEWSFFLFWNEFETERPPEIKARNPKAGMIIPVTRGEKGFQCLGIP
jgi:hypothetical protein